MLVLDECLIRAVTLEKKHLVLLPIIIGQGSSVGAKTTVEAGAIIPPNTHLGPLSSSHELDDAKDENKKYCRSLNKGPPTSYIVFLGIQ